MKKGVVLTLVLLSCVLGMSAQILKPVTWSFSDKQISDIKFELMLTAKIDNK